MAAYYWKKEIWGDGEMIKAASVFCASLDEVIGK
jgi:hypothetical protein